jgi:hypothetical protein
MSLSQIGYDKNASQDYMLIGKKKLFYKLPFCSTFPSYKMKVSFRHANFLCSVMTFYFTIKPLKDSYFTAYSCDE